MRTSGGELAVLDWESAELDGLPGVDLAYFLAYLAFFVEKIRRTEPMLGGRKLAEGMLAERMLAAYRRAADLATPTGRLQAACQAAVGQKT